MPSAATWTSTMAFEQAAQLIEHGRHLHVLAADVPVCRVGDLDQPCTPFPAPAPGLRASALSAHRGGLGHSDPARTRAEPAIRRGARGSSGPCFELGDPL